MLSQALLSFLLSSVLAPVSVDPAGLADPGSEPSATALDDALARVSVKQIEADLTFLASDALAGRDTPSSGLEVAARYLRTRAMAAGMQPGAGESYFHTYPLAYNRVDEEATRLRLKGAGGELELTYGEDYFIPSTRALDDVSYTGGVVYVGEGSADELEGLELEGKWAFCVDSSGSWRKRQRDIEASGALGLVVVPPAEVAGEDKERKPYSERFARTLRASRKPAVGWPRSRRSQDQRPLPTTYIADPGAARLLALTSAASELASLKLGADLELELTDDRGIAGDRGMIDVENVCAFWPGRDAELSKEVLIVSAHYDHVGLQGGEIHNGADDNGSGTVTLLALADALTSYGPLERSILLIWVSGEEKGLLGSRAWALDPSLPEGYRAVANINIDMVGRNDPNNILVTPTAELEEHYNGLTRLVEKYGPMEDFHEVGSCDKYWERSDQMEFAKLDIPVCFLFAGVHEDYHKPGDDVEKIDFDKIRRVTRLVLRVIDRLQDKELNL